MARPRYCRCLYLSVVTLLLTLPASAQLDFSFNRSFISQESTCVSLAEQQFTESPDISDDMYRFGETPLEHNVTRDIFRVVTYGQPGELKDIVIRSIEKRDSTCVVTIKFLMKKNQVFVHSKVYDLGKWKDFKKLSGRYYRKYDRNSTVKIFHRDNCHQLYEDLESGRYRSLTGREANNETAFLIDYLEYLLSPIFEYGCE
jgi:hypothetical protein